ncbi:thiolase family protein [Streptomyces sp. 3214.6]|uniref:thiolase family protein n=1 Tax=Streptomyces sp. 3214.6 TaxID=1882757 RepID=UPI00090A3144|nr:thiolase family protein [Streptomyces sp. 3214.6]SHI26132.1 acetyl-CoA acyltransferase [Streptomyces sp. 3214.6]
MDAYILDAVRTPFGANRGGLSAMRVDDLAARPLRVLMARHPDLDPADIEDVIYGNANGAGEDNRNVARMAVLLAGLPVSVPATTVNRLCGSGAEAVVQAARAIASGQAGLVVAGGVEGMSRAPYVLPPIDSALPRTLKLESTTVGWRMPNPAFPGHWVEPLGRSAERVAAAKGISRREQDEWAVRSHTLAHEAWQKGLHDHVFPVAGVERDESIRPGTTPDVLASLRPAFSADGTVTAGNASPVNDGAAAVLLGTLDHAKRLGAEPLARVVASAVVGVEPDRFALAPVPAVHRVLERAGRSLSDLRVLEINEAFAAMVLSCLDELGGITENMVNPNGGAIALGHPLGASAARALVDCAREVRRRGGGLGVMAACIGVGQGIAVLVEA